MCRRLQQKICGLDKETQQITQILQVSPIDDV